MTKTALLLVDIQNDYFPGGKFEVHGMAQAAKNAARLLPHAREVGHLVVHIRHEMTIENPPFFAAGSVGAEIHPIVAPHEGEAVLVKHRPNSFLGTGLKEILDDAGVEKVIVCGAMSQMCIDATTRAAADFGYQVVVVADACGAKEQMFDGVTVPAPQVHATILSALSGTYGQVVSVDDVVK